MSAIKLRDFFLRQSTISINTDRKAQILSQIKQQTHVHPVGNFVSVRSSWYFKTMTTAALAFVMMYVLYTPLTNTLVPTDQNGILITRTAGMTVQAGYIGKLLTTK